MQLMQMLGAFLLLAAVALAAYGWGRPVTQWAYGHGRAYPAFAAAVGVAVLTAIGGVLNLLELAYAPALAALLVTGWGLAAVMLRRDRARAGDPDDVRADAGERFIRLALVLLTGFLAAGLMPAGVFNSGDDFNTYFPRPLRMLATGTLGGDEFDLLGTDSFGAQAFWHGFFVQAGGLKWLNGFDAVFCYLLAGMLLIDLRRRLAAPVPYLFAAALVFVAINPQIVNVSTLFSGVAMILAIAFAALHLEPGARRRLAPFALLLAALLALKTTFVLFAAVFAVLYFGLRGGREGAAGLKAAAITAGVCVLALAPWLALHAANYLAAFGQPQADGAALGRFSAWAELFSLETLSYGGRAAYYAAIIVLLTVGAGVAAHAYRRAPHRHVDPVSATLAATCVAAAVAYPAGVAVTDWETALRYACPALIATLPLLLLAIPRLLSVVAPTRAGIGVWVAVAIVLPLVGAFTAPLAERIERIYAIRTPVAFTVKPGYLRYNEFALGEPGQRRIGAAQQRVPAGEKLLTWVSLPFHLDFSRNPVSIATEPGWMNRWLGLPLAGGPEVLRAYFQARGIRYLLWEHSGFAVSEERWREFLLSPVPLYRRLGQVNLAMRDAWRQLAQSSQVLYNADGIALIDLGAGTPDLARAGMK